MFAEVLVEVKSKKLDQTFTYQIPEVWKRDIKVGVRVLVPFGNRSVEGFVMSISSEKKVDYALKEILELVDEDIVLNEELLGLGSFISKKTLASKISSYQTMLPSALKAKKGTKVNKKYESYICLIQKEEHMLVKSAKQQEILDMCKTNSRVLKKEAAAISPSALKTLLEKGYIKEEKEEVYRLREDARIGERVTLSTKQQELVDIVKENLETFSPYLLHGVTGSGKTEVYMSMIDLVLQQNKEAIVLVPEISLTPQIVKKFKNRFGNAVAILHSRLSPGEKYDEWRKIARGEVSIAIGARSAVFAPFTNLGIIIIDEEHSSTYKQDNHPRYHAIDIALKRTKTHHCPLILGSATPSIESYTRVKLGVYQLLELKTRIHNQMPKVHLIPMDQEIKKGRRILSQLLEKKITETLELGNQVILLLNRRGFSTVISCHSCGFVHSCPHCEMPLTFHKTNYKMTCHHCGYTTFRLKKCPDCQSEDMTDQGMGTQKLAEEIQKRFPSSKILRMDMDTTTQKGSHEQMISDFEQEKYNILIGTQMIAKGLDFPKVTLVGVVSADSTLNIPDFRSAERTFQLLNQVAGRAGRSESPGEVLIQTFNPDHYSIFAASIHDYQKFYEQEMQIRKKLSYPPYSNLTLLQLSSVEESLLHEEAKKVKIFLEQNIKKDTILLGPSSAAMPKVNRIYYVNIIIKYKKTEELLPVLLELQKQMSHKTKVNLDIDLYPQRI